MAETLRELVVVLSLDSSNFSRNMRTINQQIKEAESTFRLAGAGVENYEKAIAGTESKLSMLGQKLTQQQRAVEQYSRALVAANDKLKENYNRHQDYTQRLEQAKARQEDLRFEVEAATVAYENYRDSLGETDSATIAAKQNLERYQEEYADATAEVTKLEGQVKALQKTMQNSADAVSKATTDLNNAKAAVKDTEAEIRRLTEQLYRMQSAWTQAGESLTAISKKCETISKAMTKAGKRLTTHVTAPITALGTAAVKASVDYEYAFADVRKTVDATEEEYDRLSQSVKQMSTEVAASAEDIAEVMSIAGQLGIENEHLAEFTRTMIDLGNSTNLVAADAASEAARFANIMGMSQGQFQNLGSALVDLGNNYATTESEILAMSMRLDGAGKQVGLSEAQILGFATALSSVGIEAQMGGSAFSKALVKMEVASATGGDALEDFAKVSGMTAKQFKALWDSDPAAAFQSFIVGLSKMDEEGESAIATLEEIGIKEVRLRDTLLRSTNATELFSRAQETANRAWRENAALTNEANKRYATTKSRLTNLKNTALDVCPSDRRRPESDDPADHRQGQRPAAEVPVAGCDSAPVHRKMGCVCCRCRPCRAGFGQGRGCGRHRHRNPGKGLHGHRQVLRFRLHGGRRDWRAGKGAGFLQGGHGCSCRCAGVRRGKAGGRRVRRESRPRSAGRYGEDRQVLEGNRRRNLLRQQLGPVLLRHEQGQLQAGHWEQPRMAEWSAGRLVGR